ncbi:MAG: histone deacetylase [Moraxellaceae bacterium]|nr:histone deacetylase [Moraxellaceae bacterium]
MAKYRLLRESLIHSKLFSDKDFHVPPAATDAQIMRAHTAAYLQRAADGTLDADEIRRIGFPWTPQMIERSRRSSGATIEAARSALRDGCAANLAGGTHHAHADFGSGFCVFNDAAIAARAMQAEEAIGQVAIIDCDVHQGDGTAAILADDPTVFTFSIHGAKNFPFRKQLSDLDVELADDTGDGAYLDALRAALDEVFSRCRPELVIYLAGADPFKGDRLGRLSLSLDGLRARDDMVLAACQVRGVPVAIAMAGGYAEDIAETVAIHAATITLARQRFA